MINRYWKKRIERVFHRTYVWTAMLLTIFCTMFMACERKYPASSTSVKQTSIFRTIINEPGVYSVQPGGYKLEISLVPDGDGHLVRYSLYAKDDNQTLFSDNAGSNFSRWFLYWATSEELWVYSGDIGLFLWTKVASGRYEKQIVRVGDKDILRKMPPHVYNNLPSSMKKHW